MKSHTYCRYALTVGVVAALLAGCSGSQLPVGAPGAATQTAGIATHAGFGQSWMRPGAKRRDLLYVSSGSFVYVYSYPRGGKVGMLAGFSEPRGECADAAGNIFITDSGTFATYEFAHGGTTPIATLYGGYSLPSACSIDPTTGNLAVVALVGVSVFAHNKRGWRYPKPYHDGIYFTSYGGYDNEGNLFVDGTSAPPSTAFQFQELKKGSNTFVNVALDQAVQAPGQVQWDGQFLAVGDSGVKPSVIYQFSVTGSSGSVQGTTILRGTTKSVRQFWIRKGKVVAPDYGKDDKSFLGFYKYPAGGSPNQTIAIDGAGSVVSPAK